MATGRQPCPHGPWPLMFLFACIFAIVAAVRAERLQMQYDCSLSQLADADLMVYALNNENRAYRKFVLFLFEGAAERKQRHDASQ
jgi:hypothetical protein